ncbi:hypothetical protein PR048_001918 [Dryococelus australis]|uniref:Uncharacterized protein n=1 Tax=Dryococelus australis TaxID=614101 RepID=A0ABQ9IK39_9NEOP|nr:hypothetical protein PR048_001918 [Dryococelus australis]
MYNDIGSIKHVISGSITCRFHSHNGDVEKGHECLYGLYEAEHLSLQVILLHKTEEPGIYTVVDGGFLLHRVKWNVGTKFYSICEQYVSYLINHYSSTKHAEQKWRGTP